MMDMEALPDHASQLFPEDTRWDHSWSIGGSDRGYSGREMAPLRSTEGFRGLREPDPCIWTHARTAQLYELLQRNLFQCSLPTIDWVVCPANRPHPGPCSSPCWEWGIA